MSLSRLKIYTINVRAFLQLQIFHKCIKIYIYIYIMAVFDTVQNFILLKN